VNHRENNDEEWVVKENDGEMNGNPLDHHRVVEVNDFCDCTGEVVKGNENCRLYHDDLNDDVGENGNVHGIGAVMVHFYLCYLEGGRMNEIGSFLGALVVGYHLGLFLAYHGHQRPDPR